MGPTPQKAKPLSLTQVASSARKGIAVGAITVVVLIVGRIFLDSFTAYWAATHPTPPPPPTRGFGILPKLAFPQNVGTPTSYKLEVPSSRRSIPGDRAKVFFMPTQRPSLLALDRAKKEAANLGYIVDPTPITQSIYRFSRSQPLPSSLDYNIINGTFAQKLDWQSDPTFLQTKTLQTEDDAIASVRSLLSGASLLETDLATGSAKVTYLKASADGYTPAVSLSESDFLQIDLFRTGIDDTYDIMTEEPTKGAVRVIMTGNPDRSLQYASVEYNYLPIDYASVETYPIIMPSQAFDALRSGKGYVASMPNNQTTDVVIRDIRLAYYDSATAQEYLQPIYVLSGDGDFAAYVPAIPAIWQVQ